MQPGGCACYLFCLDVSRDEVLVGGRADHKMVSQRQQERSAPGAVLADGNKLKIEKKFSFGLMIRKY
jgi:hypothetical protein